MTRELTEVNRKFLVYYGSKMSAGRPPYKTAIEPTEMPALLENLVIYERRDPDFFLIRLMGTKVVERIGQDLTGQNVLSLINYAEKARLRDCLNRLLDEPCGHYSRVVDRYASGREAVVEVLRLPLLDAAGQARFIISSTCELTASGFGAKADRPVLIAKPVADAFFALV